MTKQLKRRRSEIVQSSKRPSKVSVLAELLRVTEQAGTMEISRDYFRANSRFRDKWNMYWVSFKAFLAAAWRTTICTTRRSWNLWTQQ